LESKHTNGAINIRPLDTTPESWLRTSLQDGRRAGLFTGSDAAQMTKQYRKESQIHPHIEDSTSGTANESTSYTCNYVQYIQCPPQLLAPLVNMSKQAMKKYFFAVYPLGLSLKIFTKIVPLH